MRVFLVVLGLIIILLQAATSYAWIETNLIEQLSKSFGSLYVNGTPSWIQWAFSIGYVWYGISVVLFVLLIFGAVYRSMNLLLYLTLAMSTMSLGFMWYAMYPLHIMFSGGINI